MSIRDQLPQFGSQHMISSLIAVSLCEQSTLAKEKDVIPDQIPPPTWCIASASATDSQLQGFIDYACAGKIDCRFILPGGDCYDPNTPRGHGSYCLDAYYRIYKDCNQIGTIVYKDPSYGNCLYI
ncbi:major pollen allergen Ole e 10-like [Heracleum sosnowskyi]|uniref:Major pollen allergen Ole e 10-like n=1 Tax=Heracleum sosnowskyi TaxID=360622 RepID=A0AAD8JGA0_9APIA|nr:major pollen allergen Ole e 10-like [Heracleum sosnowskyi]